MADRTLYVQTFTVSSDGRRLSASPPRIEGMHPDAQRALMADGRPFLRLPIRRLAHVMRLHGRGGDPLPIARLYLSVAGQLDPHWIDTYFLTRIARGEPVIACWDGRTPADEERARARYEHNAGDAMLGVCRLLAMIESTSADLVVDPPRAQASG